MNITEMIAKLEVIKNIHGDLKIFCSNRYNETVDCYQITAMSIAQEIKDFYYIGEGKLEGKILMLNDEE
jgi:hypothetical protein